MKAVILAAGNGTKLEPMTEYLHQALYPIYDKPAIEIVFEKLEYAGIDKDNTAIVIGLNNQIQLGEYLKDKGYQHILLQHEQKGTVHAIQVAEDFVDDDKFIVHYADNIYQHRIKDFVRDFDEGDFDMGIIYRQFWNLEGIRKVILNQQEDIIDILEKRSDPVLESGWGLIGVMGFTPEIFESMGGKTEITDAIREAIQRDAGVYSYKMWEQWWFDIGTIDGAFGALWERRKDVYDHLHPQKDQPEIRRSTHRFNPILPEGLET